MVAVKLSSNVMDPTFVSDLLFRRDGSERMISHEPATWAGSLQTRRDGVERTVLTIQSSLQTVTVDAGSIPSPSMIRAPPPTIPEIDGEKASTENGMLTCGCDVETPTSGLLRTTS